MENLYIYILNSYLISDEKYGIFPTRLQFNNSSVIDSCDPKETRFFFHGSSIFIQRNINLSARSDFHTSWRSIREKNVIESTVNSRRRSRRSRKTKWSKVPRVRRDNVRTSRRNVRGRCKLSYKVFTSIVGSYKSWKVFRGSVAAFRRLTFLPPTSSGRDRSPFDRC